MCVQQSLLKICNTAIQSEIEINILHHIRTLLDTIPVSAPDKEMTALIIPYAKQGT